MVRPLVSLVLSSNQSLLHNRTLYSWCFKPHKYIDFNPFIIKIDIEGHEYECILGSLNTIKKYKPIKIENVVKAMIYISKNDTNEIVFESDELERIAKSN